MKTKQIQTKDYIFIIDEEAEIKEGDYLYNSDYQKVVKTDIEYIRSLNSNKTLCSICNKIIAYYPLTKEVKELDLPLLPNPFKEVDIEKLANDKYPVSPQKRKIFIDGYKSAQSKQFSLEDIQKAFEAGVAWHINPNISELDAYTSFIQSLSTQQLPISFEPEYEYDHDDSVPFPKTKTGAATIKTIINSEGKQELVGTYFYA